MYFTKPQIFFVTIITNVLLPLSVVFGLALIKSNQINLFAYFSICIVAYLFFYLLYKFNPWEFTFTQLRFLPFICITLVIILGLHSRGASYVVHKYDYWIEVASILLILLMSHCIYKIYKASRKPENVLNLEFPFKGGKYLITDGGDGYLSALMNYHYKSSTHNEHGTQDSMRYAVDIVKMGLHGRTTSRLVAFSDNSDYTVFHQTIFSPIDGIVVKVQDGVSNNEPFPGKGKLPYNLGNYIVIKNADYYVIMGHMEKESILIKEGDYIHTGDQIGLIGNSGLTPRPHLHLQVSKCKDGNYWAAEGVPVFFNQKFYPVKNSVINV